MVVPTPRPGLRPVYLATLFFTLGQALLRRVGWPSFLLPGWPNTSPASHSPKSYRVGSCHWHCAASTLTSTSPTSTWTTRLVKPNRRGCFLWLLVLSLLLLLHLAFWVVTSTPLRWMKVVFWWRKAGQPTGMMTCPGIFSPNLPTYWRSHSHCPPACRDAWASHT